MTNSKRKKWKHCQIKIETFDYFKISLFGELNEIMTNLCESCPRGAKNIFYFFLASLVLKMNTILNQVLQSREKVKIENLCCIISFHEPVKVILNGISLNFNVRF